MVATSSGCADAEPRASARRPREARARRCAMYVYDINLVYN
jgi:hypothetical protein